MVPEEKAKYERMAAEDRERYNRECAVSVIVLVRAILPAITAGACVWHALSRRRVTVSVTYLYYPNIGVLPYYSSRSATRRFSASRRSVERPTRSAERPTPECATPRYVYPAILAVPGYQSY
jgi:hypothetical protein